MRSMCCLLMCCVIGCSRRLETQSSVLGTNDTEYVVTILLDMSGSFEHRMTDGGKGYEFALQVIDRYFRERVGSNDALVIAQISANDRALLWQGTPMQLRQQFPSSENFAAFLRQNALPQGSLVHAGISRSLEYAMSHPAVAKGKAKSATFILSDMLDNGPEENHQAVNTTALSWSW